MTPISIPCIVVAPHFLNDLFRVSKYNDLVDVFLFYVVDSKEEREPFSFIIAFSTDPPRKCNHYISSGIKYDPTRTCLPISF